MQTRVRTDASLDRTVNTPIKSQVALVRHSLSYWQYRPKNLTNLMQIINNTIPIKKSAIERFSTSKLFINPVLEPCCVFPVRGPYTCLNVLVNTVKFPPRDKIAIIQTKTCKGTDFINCSFDDSGSLLRKLGGHSSEPSEQSFFPSSTLLLSTKSGLPLLQ